MNVVRVCPYKEKFGCYPCVSCGYKALCRVIKEEEKKKETKEVSRTFQQIRIDGIKELGKRLMKEDELK
jgi:ATP-dependent helicase/DNAse subunit B